MLTEDRLYLAARAVRDQEGQARDVAVALYAELSEQLPRDGTRLTEPVVLLGLARQLMRELDCLLGMKGNGR